MSKLLSMLILMTLSGASYAHEGHGAPSLFHHFEQLIPAIVLVAVMVFMYWKIKK